MTETEKEQRRYALAIMAETRITRNKKMSRFEILVEKMRAAQIAYNEKPTGDNLNAVEDLEEEVDDYLAFCRNCHAMTFNDVKKFLKTAGL